ncbi:hypothetical protein IW261DRAFT_922924 [Armillaria novae-zelandiae]|uniref:Uncharacterized protein n=1 Tax=Armillaria novae-zelandiae TaxID=153914 RepID=A0AA39TUY6_9AGAR|nr:hypothetical protein IW261DRAFT_922924 [Armillaria novae-zelandiae]
MGWFKRLILVCRSFPQLAPLLSLITSFSFSIVAVILLDVSLSSMGCCITGRRTSSTLAFMRASTSLVSNPMHVHSDIRSPISMTTPPNQCSFSTCTRGRKIAVGDGDTGRGRVLACAHGVERRSHRSLSCGACHHYHSPGQQLALCQVSQLCRILLGRNWDIPFSQADFFRILYTACYEKRSSMTNPLSEGFLLIEMEADN